MVGQLWFRSRLTTLLTGFLDFEICGPMLASRGVPRFRDLPITHTHAHTHIKVCTNCLYNMQINSMTGLDVL